MLQTDTAVETHLDASRDRRLRDYLDFLRIPSISADPEYAADCQRAADWLAARLESIGMDHVEASPTGGHPIVYADWLGADGAPTVVVYGHYDVQPVDPLDEWTSPPFEPAVVGTRVLARGASDDKSNITIFLQAVEALLATRGRLPVNLRFVFEGEEESASVHLEPWLAANRDRLTGDLAVVSDVGFFEGNLPALTIGLRGLMYAQIDVTGPFQDVHSGVYGGAIANPANALATIIAALKGPDGRIRIPGFYDDVVPLSEADLAAYAALPFDEEHYRAALGVPELVGEAGYTTLERKTGRPTLDVNGILGRLPGLGDEDDHPRPGDRQDQLPARAGPAARADLRAAPGLRRGDRARPGSGSSSATSAAGSRSAPRSTTRRSGPPPGRSRRPSAGPRSTSARAGRSRSSPRSRASSGCRSCSWASCPRTATSTPRTSGWTSSTSRAGSGRSCAISTSWRPPGHSPFGWLDM